jgi:hypothetical protein
MQRSNPKRCRADRLEANWSKDGQAEAHRVCGSEKKDRDRSAITVEKDWSREKVESRNPAQNFVPIFCNYPQTRQSETDFAKHGKMDFSLTETPCRIRASGNAASPSQQ